MATGGGHGNPHFTTLFWVLTSVQLCPGCLPLVFKPSSLVRSHPRSSCPCLCLWCHWRDTSGFDKASVSQPSKYFFLIFEILLFCGCFAYMCVYVPQTSDTLTLELQMVEPPCGCGEPNLGLQEEQPVLSHLSRPGPTVSAGEGRLEVSCVLSRSSVVSYCVLVTLPDPAHCGLPV